RLAADLPGAIGGDAGLTGLGIGRRRLPLPGRDHAVLDPLTVRRERHQRAVVVVERVVVARADADQRAVRPAPVSGNGRAETAADLLQMAAAPARGLLNHGLCLTAPPRSARRAQRR